MRTNTKIMFLAAIVFAFCYAGSAKADYWNRHTRSTSGDALPQYLELENMAKSSGGVKLLYGVNRIGGLDNENGWERNLISFDGTNWTDKTEAAKAAANHDDIMFFSMHADEYGNVWMPNRGDPNNSLIKYNGSSGSFERIDSTTIAQQVGASGTTRFLVKNIFGNRNDTNLLYAVALSDNPGNESRLYILSYNISSDQWSDTGITGGPLTHANANKDAFGLYNASDSSFWVYEYRSSEYEYNNQGDRGIGIWKYSGGSWTQYNSSTATNSGTNFVNGITEAMADSDGNIWVGSRHGAFRYSNGSWENWTKENSNVFTNRVQRIQEDGNGRMWIVALSVENSTDENNIGGISIYDNDTGEWSYYTSYNGEDALANATNIFMIGGDEAWMFTGHGEEAMTAGIYQLIRDDFHTAVYGQTSGTTVEKTALEALKKSSAKKVTITKKYRIQKKNKRYKWKKRVIYRGKSTSGWYKKLNLDAGENIKYIIKIQGKKKRTINASSGDPIRVNFN